MPPTRTPMVPAPRAWPAWQRSPNSVRARTNGSPAPIRRQVAEGTVSRGSHPSRGVGRIGEAPASGARSTAPILRAARDRSRKLPTRARVRPPSARKAQPTSGTQIGPTTQWDRRELPRYLSACDPCRGCDVAQGAIRSVRSPSPAWISRRRSRDSWPHRASSLRPAGTSPPSRRAPPRTETHAAGERPCPRAAPSSCTTRTVHPRRAARTGCASAASPARTSARSRVRR